MIRAAIAGVVGFILIFVESLLIMKLKGYETIEFGGLTPFINVWAMNFFVVFAILTQVTNWFENRADMEKSEDSY
ncbi:hypothetical protein PH210_18985 [Paenibacillus sp. BSR1-1]|uniref:hypothetical protein n=1 Tax=Paenibacillus sp. BSR1-1 TaxID=3020845 RepID=UPI0025B08629|nr:hypothetical protein [Paenibacillus sp. BSR1-1]MDN3018267.1 hypothetical protein [Paenibacillus sp. BSR1-1]